MQSVSGIILGAGPSSEGGELPPGLLTLDGEYSVLHWIDSALKHHVNEPINFVGGYRVKDIAKKHPHFAYALNPDWESSGVLESLYHARTCMTERFIVSYSDIVYRRSVVDALLSNHNDDIVIATINNLPGALGNKNRVTIGHNGTLKNIGFLSSSREVNGQFTGLTLFQNAGARLAQQFFQKEYSVQRNQPFEQAKKLKHGYLTDFIRYALTQGLQVRCVDVTGDWSEINEISSLAKFVLGTKGETLQRMMPVLRKSNVPPLEYFTVGDWQKEPGWVLERISQKFSSENIAIRSSSQMEDGWKSSGAGQFLSVLNLQANDVLRVPQAINQVINSYHCDDVEIGHQFIVQKMVKDVRCSGVVFTSTLEAGAPYYVINYELSDKTDGITSGTAEQAKLVYIRKAVGSYNLPLYLKNLLEAIDEIESKVSYQALDIEFAIDCRDQVYVLQVRPITVSFRHQMPHENHKLQIEDLKRSFNEAGINHGTDVLGDSTLLSNMADWNPAEMIGAVSYPLSVSLYHHLITQSVWAQARLTLGYKDMSQYALMKVLAGRPYIDLRLSFNSYLPAKLPDDTGEKLVNAWLKRVQNTPYLHDKVEFDVAYTCWHFDFEANYCWLQQNGLSLSQLQAVNVIYKEHTQYLLRDYQAKAVKLQDNLQQLEEFRQQINARPNGINSAIQLLDKCRDLGTFSFSIYARWAFVAATIVRSLAKCGALTSERATSLENSVQTVASELQEDQQRLQRGEITLDKFMKSYGHLRPGAYDICASRYDAMTDIFLAQNVPRETAQKATFTLTEHESQQLNTLFKTHLNFSVDGFMAFFHFAVAKREYGKFIFSRSLSDAIEHIKRWGITAGLQDNQLQLLTFQNLAQLTYSGNSDVQTQVQQLISSAKLAQRSFKSILLPDLICQSDNFDKVEQPDCKPNFVTRERIMADLIYCQQHTKAEELDNRVVLIDSADPGFDWIFTRNIKGLVTKYGGAASHMTIRAAEFGLPAAIGCGAVIFDSLKNCKAIVLDCSTETVSGL